MSASQRLRNGDVETICRLVEECRELGADARVWQRHMLLTICRLAGCRTGGSSEVRPSADGMAIDWATPVEVGRTQSEARQAYEFLAGGEYPPDEFCLELSRSFIRHGGDELTRSRGQLIDDSTWSRSETRQAYLQLGQSDIVMALARVPGTGRALCLGFTRGVGDRPTGTREARLLELFVRLARPHLGRGLALTTDPGIADLSRRRRQVLAGLLDGLAEKQIAGKLHLSLPTVHEYVMDLYRHFGIGSRGELLALFLRRRNGPAEQWLERFRDVDRDGVEDVAG